MRSARAGLFASLLVFASCSSVEPPSPSTSPVSASTLPTSEPTPTSSAEPEATSPSPTRFRFDVVNRSGADVVVSVASDYEADLIGFAAGQSGTVVVQLGNPLNGIGIEVQGAQCAVLATANYPTTSPFTLVIGKVGESGQLQLSTRTGTASSPIPLPSNSIVGCRS
jgi:hypothetical protein